MVMTHSNFKLRPRSWLFLCMMLGINLALFSQNNPSTTQQNNVLEKSELYALVQSGADSGITLLEVEQLYEGKNPSIYITGNVSNLVLYSQSAKNIETDAVSLVNLENSDPNYTSVELIKIKIKSAAELTTLINNGNWRHFSNLKFVHIHFEFHLCPTGQNIVQCEKQEVADLFQQLFPDNIYLTYSKSIAE